MLHEMEIETERSNPDIRKSSPSSNANQFPSYICSITSYILTSLCLILSCTIQFFVVVAIIAIPLRWSLLIDIFKWNANSKRTSSSVLPTHTHTYSLSLYEISVALESSTECLARSYTVHPDQTDVTCIPGAFVYSPPR